MLLSDLDVGLTFQTDRLDLRLLDLGKRDIIDLTGFLFEARDWTFRLVVSHSMSSCLMPMFTLLVKEKLSELQPCLGD